MEKSFPWALYIVTHNGTPTKVFHNRETALNYFNTEIVEHLKSLPKEEILENSFDSIKVVRECSFFDAKESYGSYSYKEMKRATLSETTDYGYEAHTGSTKYCLYFVQQILSEDFWK